MRVRLSSADLLDELLEFLRAEPGAVVEQVSDDEVEVSLLGSFQQDALRMQLELRLRAWEATQRARGVRFHRHSFRIVRMVARSPGR